MIRLLAVAFSIAFCLTLSEATARLVEAWPFERLHKESDLVIIGTAVTTKETSADTFVDERWPLELVGVNTTFEILQIIKGESKEKRIEVLHFKFGKVHEKAAGKKLQIIEIIDGPRFVSFHTTPRQFDIDGAQLLDHKLEYMLYLKKCKDGRYEPVSGRIDPDLSVRELFVPIFSRSDGLKRVR